MTNQPNTARACNSACALNNVGVHLMMQGHFEGAAATLKDALTVMRATLQSANQPIHQDAEALLQFSQQRMQSAARRLSNNRPEQQEQQQQASQLPFQLTCIESNDFDALKNAAAAETSSFSAVLIRDTCTQASQQQQREWAIILLNYALACFFLTCTTSDRRKQGQFSAICYKSLVMAQQTFAPNNDGNATNPVEQVERVFWTLLALTSTAQCMRAYQQHDKAQEAEQTRKTLLTAVLSHEHHRRLSWSSSEHLVAAAA